VEASRKNRCDERGLIKSEVECKFLHRCFLSGGFVAEKSFDKTSIYQVADAAGVSIATVSRVMNHPERVAPSTRERVLEVVSSLGFIPSMEGLSRSRYRFKRIGIILPYAWSYSYSHRMEGVSSLLSPLEFEIITYAVEEERQLENYLTMLSAGDRVDGVIIFSLPAAPAFLTLFRRRGIPVVLVEQEAEGAFSIMGDDYLGGALAAEHLIEKGYRKPAFIGVGGVPAHITNSAEKRFAGFRESFLEAGVEIPWSFVEYHFHGLSHTLISIERLLTRPERADAVFAASDYEAMILLQELRRRGIGVPEDIGLIGYDNIEAARFMELTTIDQHLQESGKLAAALIRDYLRGTLEGFLETRRLEPVLVQGQTT
jgi:LacI family transcriptional regulator